MNRAAYLRFEILRTLRNRRFSIFSFAFPLVIFLAVGGANAHGHIQGVSVRLYLMAGMAAWGSMIAIVSTGARIATERKSGWIRQLRITPLTMKAYFSAKLVSAYLMALATIVLLYLAGTALGVRLDASQWGVMTLLLLVGLLPFAALGVMLGHLLRPDSLGPAVGGLTAMFALLGGAWGPISTSHMYVELVKLVPSYWLVQSSSVAFGGSGWPPIEAWIVIAVWVVVLARLAILAYRRDTARI